MKTRIAALCRLAVTPSGSWLEERSLCAAHTTASGLADHQNSKNHWQVDDGSVNQPAGGKS